MEGIEAVIFDWGGVLIEDPAAKLMSYCAEALGVSAGEYIGAHLKFADDFVTGRISEEQYWSGICSQLGKEKPPVKSLWSVAFERAYQPREDVFALADELQENGYSTAVLSNTERPSVQFFYRRGYDNVFNVTVFSCIEGMKKPERRIYDLAAGRLGVAAGECVFIDDRCEFVEAAVSAGMKGIVFKDIGQLIRELSRLGVNTA